ncbi:MAG: alpha/beta hydrolase [bacterium]|nr:alpha/beta hydrolase [bacterium]
MGGQDQKSLVVYRTKRACALVVAALVVAGCSTADVDAPLEASSEAPLSISQDDDSQVDSPPDAYGTSVAPAVPEATFTSEPLPPAASYAIVPQQCERRYLCATLEVPADHGNPEAGSITLELGMLPASDEDRRIGVLLVNPGGPGQGMDGFLDYGAGLSPDVLNRFDVVGWNPRGVTADTAPDCEDEAEELQFIGALSDTPDNEARIAEVAKQAAESCLAGLSGREHLIGTVQTVHDMDLIRQALGEEQISYLGYSYGTILGQFYSDLYGPNARAVVLDGVMDSSLSHEDLLVGQILGFARVTDEVFAACRQDSACPTVGDPKDAYFKLMKRLESEPLLNSAGEVVAGPGHATVALASVSYASKEAWWILYEAFSEALDGNGEKMRELAWSYTRSSGGLGPFFSIGCTDSGRISEDDLNRLVGRMTEVAGEFGRAAAAEARMCAYWSETKPRPHRAISAPDAPPVLVVGNRGDSATPYEWAVAVAESLDTGVLLTYNGQGHTSYGRNSCVDEIVDDYLINLTMPPNGTECG